MIEIKTLRLLGVGLCAILLSGCKKVDIPIQEAVLGQYRIVGSDGSFDLDSDHYNNEAYVELMNINGFEDESLYGATVKRYGDQYIYRISVPFPVYAAEDLHVELFSWSFLLSERDINNGIGPSPWFSGSLKDFNIFGLQILNINKDSFTVRLRYYTDEEKGLWSNIDYDFAKVE